MKKKPETMAREFIKELQWELRSSYNSSSCLGEKQKAFLEDKLVELLYKQ